MPWLIRPEEVVDIVVVSKPNHKTTTTDNNDDLEQQLSSSVQTLQPQQSLFFVHVPRCGGTSLMHYFQLPNKVQRGRNLWYRLGMITFFSRYKTLEKQNFPFCTSGNAFALAISTIGLYFIIANYVPRLGILLVVFGIILFLLLTIVFTAPVIGRFPFVHHAYLIFVHYILCQFMECKQWCTGTNKTGYIMHLTAHKLLSYGYVSEMEFQNACSMAIVRNPYSRMISIYTYNRFGEWESFTHFMEDWYHNVTKAYRTTGELEEWYTPCHAIPQFEYTHYQQQQLVKSIIKQEELKYLKQVYKDVIQNTSIRSKLPIEQQSPSSLPQPITDISTTTKAETNNNNDDDNIDGNNNEEGQQQHDDIMIVKDDVPTPITASGEHTAEMGPSNNDDDHDMKTNVVETPATTATTTTVYKKPLSIENLPITVRDALLGMPHTNQRTLSKKWYEYYTQHTLDLVYEIYAHDFEIFDYSPILKHRPDLLPPKLYRQQQMQQHQFKSKISSQQQPSDHNNHNNNILNDDMVDVRQQQQQSEQHVNYHHHHDIEHGEGGIALGIYHNNNNNSGVLPSSPSMNHHDIHDVDIQSRTSSGSETS